MDERFASLANMPIKRIYVVYDRTAEEAGPLFESPNDGVAIRSFRNLMEKVPGYQRPDFRLYRLGIFNAHTMLLTIEVSPTEVIFSDEPNKVEA